MPVNLALDQRQVIDVRSIDVSVGGIALVAQLNLPVEAQGELSFTLRLRKGSSHVIRSRAIVRHTFYSQRNHGFVSGLQFTNLEPAMLETLQTFLAE